MQKQKNCIKFYVSDILLRKKFRFGNNPMNKQTQVAIFMSAFMVNAEATELNIFFKEYEVNDKGYTINHKHFEFMGNGKISETVPGANDTTQETCDTTTRDTQQKLPKKRNCRQKYINTSYVKNTSSNLEITNKIYKKQMCNKNYAKCQSPNCEKHNHTNKTFDIEKIDTVQKTIRLEERFKGCKHNHQYFDFMGHGNQIERIFFTEKARQNATASKKPVLTLILRALPVKPKAQVTVFNQTFANLKDDNVRWKLLCKPYFVRKKVPHKRLPQFEFYYVKFSKDRKEMFKDLPIESADFSGATFTKVHSAKKPSSKSFNQDSMKGMFSGCKYLECIKFGKFGTRHVTDMSEMFYNCESIQKLDLSTFNTSKVTTMSKMFANCQKLQHVNIITFNTANVQKMDSMFLGCESLTNLNLRKIKTDQLETAFRMFYKCADLTTIVFGKGNLNTGKLKNISAMFEGCKKLKDLDLSSFNTNYVKYMTNFVAGCSSLQKTNYHPFAEAKMLDAEHKCGIYISPGDSDESKVEESDSEDM